MLPCWLLAGMASALRMPAGTIPSAVAEPAACAAALRKSRRLFKFMGLCRSWGEGKNKLAAAFVVALASFGVVDNRGQQGLGSGGERGCLGNTGRRCCRLGLLQSPALYVRRSR